MFLLSLFKYSVFFWFLNNVLSFPSYRSHLFLTKFIIETCFLFPCCYCKWALFLMIISHWLYQLRFIWLQMTENPTQIVITNNSSTYWVSIITRCWSKHFIWINLSFKPRFIGSCEWKNKSNICFSYRWIQQLDWVCWHLLAPQWPWLKQLPHCILLNAGPKAFSGEPASNKDLILSL